MSAPQLERSDEIRRGHRVVDHQRHARLVGDLGHALDVEHVVHRVADRLAVEQFRVGPDGGPPLVEIVEVVDERGLDPELRQRVVQQVVGAAVEGGGGDEVAAGLGDVHDRHRLGRLAGGDDEHRRAHRPPSRPGRSRGGQADLGNGLGGVHDAGVDVARLGEGEEVGGVFGVAELVGGGLIDRHRPGAGGGVGLLAGVDLPGFEAPGGGARIGCLGGSFGCVGHGGSSGVLRAGSFGGNVLLVTFDRIPDYFSRE